MIDLSNMVTETRNPKTMNLDEMPPSGFNPYYE
jgi:N-acetylmuramic acid 6-phosphate (MurNAc-6-P) etherase